MGDEQPEPNQDGPRYLRIQKTLEERLSVGTYPVGTLMPTEAELSREFGTSRFTIREALRHLTERGFVERRAGIGTRVMSDRGRSVYFQSYTSLEELFQVAVETFFVTNAVEPVMLSDDLAQRIGARAGERWLRISGVRWTEPGGRPVCSIHSYVPERFEAVIPSIIGQQRPFFRGSRAARGRAHRGGHPGDFDGGDAQADAAGPSGSDPARSRSSCSVAT